MPQTTAARVIAQQWVSLDGYAAGVDGESSLFEAVSPETDARSQRYNAALMTPETTVMLGRNTYELFVEYWPTASETIAAQINAVPKIVASRTMLASPWGQHNPARVVRDAVAEARLHRTERAGDLLIWGSLELVASLVAAQQLDELDLFVAPIWLGGGRSLLPRGTALGLRQTLSEDWGDVTHLRYTVER